MFIRIVERLRVARASGRLGYLLRNQQAATALEFALVMPVFTLFLMTVLGVGLDGFYQLCLDDAVRNAARQVQIAGPASTSGGNFVAAICSEFGIIASDCAANLSYNVQTNVPPANFAALKPVNMPTGGALANNFPALAANSNILLQVAYPLPFTLPYIGTAITLTGTGSILATTTVRMEPHG